MEQFATDYDRLAHSVCEEKHKIKVSKMLPQKFFITGRKGMIVFISSSKI